MVGRNKVSLNPELNIDVRHDSPPRQVSGSRHYFAQVSISVVLHDSGGDGSPDAP